MLQVYSSESQTQKEKYESDLKKQIKKLQRQRDSLKSWSASTDTTVAVREASTVDSQQYADRINDAKTEIENRMLKFRECEKETKTKAFSKEGLKQPSKQTPQDVAIGFLCVPQEKRQEIQDSICTQISELVKEVEECECEEKKEKAKKRRQPEKKEIRSIH